MIKQIGLLLSNNYFVYHSCDYRPNWTPLSPITIIYSLKNQWTFCDSTTGLPAK